MVDFQFPIFNCEEALIECGVRNAECGMFRFKAPMRVVCYLFQPVPLCSVKMNAPELLAAYRDGSDQAFADLIRRYANLVFSVAKRHLGESAAAEDVAQVVFTRLAKSPPWVSSDAELVAWLHRTTVHAAIDFWRGETRRRSREQDCVLMQSRPAEDSPVWEELSPPSLHSDRCEW